ncbi:MAG: pyruvate kinase [Desulfobacterales bacterium]|jgi:pyruvate kinase
MTLPTNKTKIVCTIGPASDSPEILEEMILAGMNVVRLNFSHGDFSGHKAIIDKVRVAEQTTGRHVAIMADLPGPKMRIGQLVEEPIELRAGDHFTLTSEDIIGNAERVSVSFAPLPQVVKPGNILFLNDGIIQLEVISIAGNDVQCLCTVGGELRSRKGLNLPGIDLGISAFTDHDHKCLKFALENGVDAVSQSFVETAADVEAVRNAAAALGHNPFIIAKIERAGARDYLDEILMAADGIMIARGDLGVETPIELMAVVQKQLMEMAQRLGKPVITATQMLESMTEYRRPTRAEATDVANAILDGTDCVMLSGESAMGKYPVESVTMLTKIAAATEPHREQYRLKEALETLGRDENLNVVDLIALSVHYTLEHVNPAGVFIPTFSGKTARSIARFRLPVWLTSISRQKSTCRHLQFSYGVFPVYDSEHPADWRTYTLEWLRSHGVTKNIVIITEGPSVKYPTINNRLEIIDLDRPEQVIK